jgi:hypothetical protein
MLCGLIWFVQVVHYPLFALVDAESFKKHHHQHTKLTTFVVLPLMSAEAIIVIVLLSYSSFDSMHLLSAGMLAAIWLSTFLIQVPLHQKLSICFDSKIHKRLVLSNWLRTALWSGRVFVCLYFVSTFMEQANLGK